jgi:hypothetical protein
VRTSISTLMRAARLELSCTLLPSECEKRRGTVLLMSFLYCESEDNDIACLTKALTRACLRRDSLA